MKRVIACFILLSPAGAAAQVAVRGETVHTMAGAALKDGVVLVKDGKIEAVGPASSITIPAGYRTLAAKVVTPGLVDARGTVGLSGVANQVHDQDQLETSAAIQPELRAQDAYNPADRLVGWVRGFGVTTVHTGHGPGALVSGQTMIVKTRGRDVETDTLVPFAMVAATLGEGARSREEGKAPGTRAKAIALLRAELIKAQEYSKKLAGAGKAPADDKDKGKEPERSLRLEALAQVLKGDVPLLATVHRAHDILTVLRLRDEFQFKLVLDGAAEAYMVKEQIKKAGVSVIVHPTMYRSSGELENLSMETASVLRKAGIPVAIESGFEGYVPKTRVVLFEAAVAAANGLSFDEALAAITIDAARLLGIEKRVGSLEVGKDGDLALYDGDPFEYTSHCTGVVIQGEVASETAN
ncbi:MAG TPA: amidohydrolase family protein [Vicinamibacteria bacterium]